jgi:hypothetical protein
MDYSTEEDKVVILGRVTAAYSIGQILGPTIAGAVAALSLQLVPIGASLVCFGGLLVVTLFLENRPSSKTVSPSKGEVARRHLSPSSSNNAPNNSASFVQDLWTACTQPLVASLLLMKVLVAEILWIETAPLQRAHCCVDGHSWAVSYAVLCESWKLRVLRDVGESVV